MEKFLLVPYPIPSTFRPPLFPIFFLLLNFWRRADWSIAILGELFFPIPWHRQIWKWRELSRRARFPDGSAAQNSRRYGQEKKKEKREREGERNKRRIRKRRRCLAEKERDDRALWRWRRVTIPEYFTIPRSVSVCQPINSPLLPIFSFSPLPSSLALSSFREFLHSVGRWYRAGNNFRANQSKRCVFLYVQIKGRFFPRVSSFTFLSPFANPPLKIPYFSTWSRIKEIEMIPSFNFLENGASYRANRIHFL